MCFLIPFQEGFIVYRPLARLAFIANRAMAELSRRLAADPSATVNEREQDAAAFLRSIGFLDPDPAAPALPAFDAPYRPTVAVLCVTTTCNCRCVYCYAQGGERQERVMPLEVGFRAIDEVCNNARAKKEERFGLVFHGGGEPTLAARELRAFVAHARSRSLPCHISAATNGLWSDETRDWLLANLDELSLSLDGTAAVQNRQRPSANGAPTFDAALAAATAMDLRKRAYGIRLTVTDESIGELAAGIGMLCRETECPVFQIEPAFAHGRASRDGKSLTAHERFARAFLESYDEGLRHGRHVYYSGSRPWLASSRFCQALDKALVVTPEGLLTACYEVCGREHPLAGRFLFGHLDLKAGVCLQDGNRARLLEIIAQRRGLCTHCISFWHCAGDCPSKTITPGGEGDLCFGPRCELNRRITRDLLLRLVEAGGGIWTGDRKLRLLSEQEWLHDPADGTALENVRRC